MKLPAFQFYPGDWRKDPGVQSLDYQSRGVWFEILCLMHESTPRGVLMLAGKPMNDDALARLLGLDVVLLKQILTNLDNHGVTSRRASDQALYCRRMVRDEEIRQKRQNAGKLGGNPSLLNQKSTTEDKQKPTPSSSSSFSASSSDIQSPPPKGGGGESQAEVDPRHHEITAKWGGLYSECFGHRYTFTGRDPKTLKRFLAACKDDAETILGVARQAWERSKTDRFASRCKEAASIHGLCTSYNEIRGQLAVPNEADRPVMR